MINVKLDIPYWDWKLNFHCAVSCYHTDQIIEELQKIGCPPFQQKRARELMESCKLDTGLTFSNPYLRESVIVVALTSSAAEFQNSLQHEIRHAVDDISNADFIRNKEALGYLTGEINLHIFPHIKHLLCDHCRCKH